RRTRGLSARPVGLAGWPDRPGRRAPPAVRRAGPRPPARHLAARRRPPGPAGAGPARLPLRQPAGRGPPARRRVTAPAAGLASPGRGDPRRGREGLMSNRILLVDDDPNALAAYQRQLRKQFAVETAQGGALGLEALAGRGPFAVVVTDMRMPGMNGVAFL